MYGKVFAQIFDGTLHGQLEATAVFMAMIAVAERDGTVDLTLTALASRTGWPVDFIRRGIEQLESEDFESRSPEEEGRRIVRLRDNTDWGWRITNYVKYRDIRDNDSRKKYMREYMRERRSKQAVNSVSAGKPQLAHADADADADADAIRGEGRQESPTAAGDVPRETRSGGKVGRGKRRGDLSHFVPDDWQVPEEDYRWALEQGYTAEFIRRETERFCDYEFKTPRSEWTRAWRNWITKDPPGVRNASPKRVA